MAKKIVFDIEKIFPKLLRVYQLNNKRELFKNITKKKTIC